MDCKEMFINGYEDIFGELERTMNGLTAEDLNWQLHPECNSIGWIAWHVTRLEDHQIAYILEKEQLWIKDGWHAKFNRPADSKDVGFGHTPEQVSEFESPDIQVFLDYNRAIFKRAKQHFSELTDLDWDQPLDEQWHGTPVKVGWRLLSVLEDCHQHTGQMAYIRGLRQGKGWQKY
ncbi:DinB family protein [Chloroflexota bacterium]